jgi:hypothetical protein
MKNHNILTILVFSALLAFAGCKTTLAPGGAYAPGYYTVTATSTNFVATGAPNTAFYVADQTFNAAYAVVDSAFKWEMDNRAALFKLDPAIKHTLDKIRPTAWNIAQRWAVARKTYEANPIPANLSTMQTLVAEIQSIIPAVTAAEALSATPTTK